MTSSKRGEGKGAKSGKSSKGTAKGWGEKDSKGKGSKGGSKGFDGKGGGKGKSTGGKGSSRETAVPANSKTFQEPGAETTFIGREGGSGERQRRSGDRQPSEFKGDHCEVKKHSEMGCAVVTMESVTARDAVLKLTMGRTPDPEDGKEKRPEATIDDVKVQLRAHVDKSEKTETEKNLFIAWGRKAEKATPLAPEAIAQAFDDLYREAQPLIGQDTVAATASPQAPTLTAAAAAPFFAFPGQMTMAGQQFSVGAQPNPAAAQMAQQYAAAMMAQQMMVQQATMAQQALMAQQVASQHVAAQQAALQQAAAMQQQQQLQQAQQQQQQQQQPQQQPSTSTQQADAAGGAAPATNPQRTGQGMRADAPAFNFTPESAAAYPDAWPAATKFEILDPNTKKPIEALGPADFEPPKRSERKAMAIIDPSSGDAIRALDFTPPNDSRTFTITDPHSGTAIKV